MSSPVTLCRMAMPYTVGFAGAALNALQRRLCGLDGPPDEDGQRFVQPFARVLRRFGKVRPGERGDGAYANNNRVELRGNCPAVLAYLNDDERELANLRHAHTNADGHMVVVAKQEGCQAPSKRLTQNEHSADKQDVGPELEQVCGVEQHTNGDEEDGSKHVTNGHGQPGH